MPEYGNMGVVSTEAVWVLELAVLKMQKSFRLIRNHWQNPEFEVRCHYFSNLSNLVDIILSNVVWRKYANVGSCSGRAHCILHTCVYSPGITQNMDWGETFKWFTVTFVMEWEFLQQSVGQQTGNTVTGLALQYPTDHENKIHNIYI